MADQTQGFITGAEALERLGIRTQTLYAYVSRGWVRSVRQPGRKQHLYVAEDIERMQARQQARAGNTAIAASAMNHGEPIIATAITEITGEGPRYRGRPALELVRAGMSFEAVTELLWTGLPPQPGLRWPVEPLPPAVRRLCRATAPVHPPQALLEIHALFTLSLGMARGSTEDRMRFGNPTAAARQILQVMAGSFGLISPGGAFVAMRPSESLAELLARAMNLASTAEILASLEAILILLADHELAPATLVTRVSASAGAALHACIVSALCAHSGQEIGRAFDRLEELLKGAGSKPELLRRFARIQAAGQTPPGFGHPLYPRGDPRADHLLWLAASLPKLSRRDEAALRFVEAVRQDFGLHPRQDIALTILTHALAAPAGSAGALFTLARAAGWVAHVLEERLRGSMLRPRARYIGP